MPDALRTAVPGGVWYSVKITAPSGGYVGIRTGIANGISYTYQVEDIIGAILEDAAAGEEAVMIYFAEKIYLQKKIGSGEVFAIGQDVYWDPADRLVSPNATSGFIWIGYAIEAAGVNDLRVKTDLRV